VEFPPVELVALLERGDLMRLGGEGFGLEVRMIHGIKGIDPGLPVKPKQLS
jgi:hypothetical protein